MEEEMLGKNSVSFLRCLAISTFLLTSCAPTVEQKMQQPVVYQKTQQPVYGNGTVPYKQDAEFELAASYYQKGLLLAEKDEQNAIPLLQKSLDIFNKLGNEEWQQKVKKALESIK